LFSPVAQRKGTKIAKVLFVFAVTPGHTYVIHAGSEQRITATAGGVLSASISLDGQTDCRIEPVE
jgi:hypothetical protein